MTEPQNTGEDMKQLQIGASLLPTDQRDTCPSCAPVNRNRSAKTMTQLSLLLDEAKRLASTKRVFPLRVPLEEVEEELMNSTTVPPEPMKRRLQSVDTTRLRIGSAAGRSRSCRNWKVWDSLVSGEAEAEAEACRP
jgi:hypothetical protein